MAKFSELFSSEYVKNLSFPKQADLVEIINRTQYENKVARDKERFSNFLKGFPTFQEFLDRVKNPN